MSRLSAIALHELSNLVADAIKRFQQFAVRLPDVLAEEFHYPEQGVAGKNRKGNSSMQPVGFGCGCTGEVVVLGDVGNPGRLQGAPDAAGQSHTALNYARARI